MKYKINIFWLILIIPLSVLIGFLTTQYSYFQFAKELNIIDIFTLLFTIFIAFYLTEFIQKNIENKRFEKDLLISNINPILLITSSLKNSIQNRSLNVASTKSELRNISNSLHNLEIYSEMCISNLNSSKLKSQYFEIKKLITGGQIQNNDYILNPLQKKTALTKLNEFNIELISGILSINRG